MVGLLLLSPVVHNILLNYVVVYTTLVHSELREKFLPLSAELVDAADAGLVGLLLLQPAVSNTL